jgi:hypothetical protein
MLNIDITLSGIVVDKSDYIFETIGLLNRLDMPIEVDVTKVFTDKALVIIVKSNKHYHRSTVSKNIEHIAFQLKKGFRYQAWVFRL